MKTPKFIEKWLARYIDGEIEGSQHKVIDEWVKSSPELRDDIENQKAVSSHLQQTLSNPEARVRMEAQLNHILNAIPQQIKAKHNPYSKWLMGLMNLRVFQIPQVSSRALSATAVFLFLGLVAVINGPVSPPNAVMDEYQSQSDAEFAQAQSTVLGRELIVAQGAGGQNMISQRSYRESSESRGYSSPPGVASNTQDYGINRGKARIGFPTTPLLTAPSSSELNTNQNYDYYMRVYGDKFKEVTGQNAATEAEKEALNQYWKRFGYNQAERLQSLGYVSNGESAGMGMSMGILAGGADKNIVRGDVDNDGGLDYIYHSPVTANIEGAVIAGKQIAQTNGAANVHIDGEAPPSANADSSSQNLEDDTPDVEEGRRIIRNARMALQTPEVLATKDRIEEMVKKLRGIISNANVNQNSEVPSAQLVLWVPADVLEQTLEELNTFGKILNLDVFTNDITEQYFDMESRVRNLKIQEERLLELYDREVKKLEEILQVEKEVQRVRTEIEQLEGRKRLWDRQVSLSTIEISIVQEPEKKPVVVTEPQDVFSPLRRIWRDSGAVLMYSCSIMTNMAASIISTILFFLPWFILIALVGLAGRFAWKRFAK